MKHGARFLIPALIIACGFALPTRAQDADDAPSPTDEQLRGAAEEILTGNEFQHFDHFERKPPPAAASDTTDARPMPAEQPPAPEAPWWERLRQRQGAKKSSSGKSKSSSGETQPSSSGENETAPPKPGESSNSKTPPSESPISTPSGQPTGNEAAAKPSRNNQPAQRGADGVERPVRHAAKTPRNRPENSSNWELNDGGFFAILGNILGVTLHLIAYAVLAAVCVLILALAARAISAGWSGRSRRTSTGAAFATPLAHDRSPGETAADVFLEQALLYAGRREYREALGQLLLGAMSFIESREWIRYRRGLTVRDYLRSVRSQPEQFEGLKVVVDAYEPVEYGRQPATQSEFESALEGYRDGFSTVTTS